MADITWTDVTDLASELENWPDNAVDAASRTRIRDLLLSYVNDAHLVSVFDGEEGSKTKLVRMLLAAHAATMLTRASSNEAGVVQSEALGPQSKSYAAISSALTPEGLQATQYGIQYVFMIQTSSARGARVL